MAIGKQFSNFYHLKLLSRTRGQVQLSSVIKITSAFTDTKIITVVSVGYRVSLKRGSANVHV